MSFKSYSNKKSALKGAQRAGLHADLVCQHEGAWGYWEPEACGEEATSQGTDTPLPGDGVVLDATEYPQTQPPCEMHEPEASQASDDAAMQQELDAQVAAGTLVRNDDGTYSMPPLPESLKNDAPAEPVATSKPKRAAREVQNGVARPRPGGKCAQVWDDCDSIVAAGGVPTPDAVKALALGRGHNENNAQIELYAWRKYNGITGRVKATPVATTPASEGEPQQ